MICSSEMGVHSACFVDLKSTFAHCSICYLFHLSELNLTRYLLYVNRNDNQCPIVDKAEEEKESEELDLTGLDETELDNVIQFLSAPHFCSDLWINFVVGSSSVKEVKLKSIHRLNKNNKLLFVACPGAKLSHQRRTSSSLLYPSFKDQLSQSYYYIFLSHSVMKSLFRVQA